jgi:hypothetical protein
MVLMKVLPMIENNMLLQWSPAMRWQERRPGANNRAYSTNDENSATSVKNARKRQFYRAMMADGHGGLLDNGQSFLETQNNEVYTCQHAAAAAYCSDERRAGHRQIGHNQEKTINTAQAAIWSRSRSRAKQWRGWWWERFGGVLME